MINIYNKHNIKYVFTVGNNYYFTENINRNNSNNRIYIKFPDEYIIDFPLTLKLTRKDDNGYIYEEYKPYNTDKSIYIFEKPFDNKNYSSYYFEFLIPSTQTENIYIDSIGFIKDNIEHVFDYIEDYSHSIEYDFNNSITNYTQVNRGFNFSIIFNREDIGEVNSIVCDEFYFEYDMPCRPLTIENKLIPVSSLNYEHKSTALVKLSIQTVKGKV